ncbi:YibE/F family protein [Alkaliphilus transvaalensis]|uniref:YibE/F family protein n=1 Tax=Alkaliphilus transvaalensis TaxID=114628 RepID=UPI00054E3CE4|nr:YibE/F family protein [Alkaliphilus transvaalensis]
MKKTVLFLVTLALLVGLTLPSFAFDFDEPISTSAGRGKVISVEEGQREEVDFVEGYIVTVEITSGAYKGKVIEIKNMLTGNLAYDLPVKAGDKIILTIEEYMDGTEFIISDYARDTYVYGIIAIFFLLILLVGKMTGLKTLVTLCLTAFFIVKVLLPGILKGYDPILLTIGISILITVITILLIGGINIKSFSAILGVLGGVLAAGFITFYIGTKVRLTGLSATEANMLMYIPQNIEFDFTRLLFSGIMLGALGAVMDVAMSVASSMEEVRKINPSISRKELMISGMNVGKDIMGTMSNTLILAYAGSAIPLLLLFMAYEINMVEIVNLDVIATEIVRAIAGSIGLILTIPITTLASGILLEKIKEKKIEA